MFRMETIDDDHNDGTQAIERAITLLKVVATRERFGWGLTELATASGLKKATTHRIMARLERERLVHRRAGSERYFLGSMIGELSLSLLGFHAFADAAAASAMELSRRLGLVVILSLRSGDHFVVLSRVSTSRLKGELNEVGARRPLISTAGGNAIVVMLEDAEQRKVVEANRAQLALRGRDSTSDYLAMWERSRTLGYGSNLGDIAPGVHAVAVAAMDRARRPFASITLAGTEALLPESRHDELVNLLQREAVQLAGMASRMHPNLYDCAEAD
jgi:DNA-binding IclR family transcriptional regulator